MSTDSILCLVAALVLGIIVVVYVVKTLRKDQAVEDGAQMPRGKRQVLTLYLLTFGAFLVFMLVSLTSLDFPETPLIPWSAPGPEPTAAAPTETGTTGQTGTTGKTALPVLIRIFPVVKGEMNTTPKLAIYGDNFIRGVSQVRFDLQVVESRVVADNLISVSVNSEYLQGRGSITVDVVNGTLISNAIPVPIEKPTAQLNVFFCFHPWITREIQLLLLVIFAGALGSYLHAIMSVTDFIGTRKLISSWFWWYITRPFLGMAMGLVFYAVLRGGFLTGSPADAKVVNPFGVLAIGALVGMFSDKAAQKLAEIFNVVFQSPSTRTDGLTGNVPLVSKVEPATIVARSAAPVTVKITGTQLGTVANVRVNTVDRPPDSKTDKEVTFKLNAEDIKETGQIEIKVITPDGIVSEAMVINVSEPTVADATAPKIASLDPATVAAGGTTPVGVKITGERLAKVTTVKVDSNNRTPGAVSETEVSFALTLEDTAEAGQLEIIVANSDGSASAPAILTVTKPKPPDTTETDTSTATVIRGLNPPTVSAGSPDTEVTITGEHLATAAKVKVNDAERAVTSATETEVSFTLTTAELATPATLKIILLDNTGKVLTTSDFVVTDAGEEGQGD